MFNVYLAKKKINVAWNISVMKITVKYIYIYIYRQQAHI